MIKEGKFSYEEKIKAVKEVLNKKKSVRQVMEELKVSRSCIHSWIRRYETEGNIGLTGFKETKHYPDELKMQAINDYNEKQIGTNEICKKYKISAGTILRSWVKTYNEFGTLRKPILTKGVRPMRGRNTTEEEKKMIVFFCIENEDNYKLASEKFKVSYNQVYSWVAKYKSGGDLLLRDKRGKRKDPETMTELEKSLHKTKLLESENLRLKMENALLKKLDELERRR